MPASISQAQNVTMDAKVLLFTGLVSLVTALIFSLAPASQASHFNLNDTLKEGGRDSGASRRGNRIRSALVISEVAVSFLLLIGAGLLITSFLHLLRLDPGYRAENLLTAKVQLPETRYPKTENRVAFFSDLLRRVQALPGVESVAAASNLPLTYHGDSMPIGVEGCADPPPDERPDVVFRTVSPGYFTTMGIRIAQGRDFTEQDRADAVRTVVISEKMARHFWPGENALGKRLKPDSTTSDGPWREVVGIVADVRQNDFAAEPKMQMYFNYEQVLTLAPNALVVRTKVDPLSLGTAVRNAVWSIDKDQPVSDIRSMEEIVSTAVARQRFSTMLLGVFAVLALVLAAVGIYGVMSYTVAQRTREIGIRIALGAQRSDVLRMTVQQGLKLVGIGVVIGAVAALVLTRVMESLLYGVSAT
ncbi:MAG: ABC transporter permease, partial [Chthoniobacterales bacterium]|nr:ABC transporter permease [Chthoniobacterales bacterium]